MADNFFGITDTGRIRKNNEDTFIAQKVLNNSYIAACVIDGVGGYNGGEVAAGLAHDAILDSLKSHTRDMGTLMRDAFASANERIYNEKRQTKGNEQMACVLTLALVDIANNKFYYAHVGDTRLYLLRDNSLVKVSRDHSFVGFLEDSGRLSEEAAMKHPKRNEINKALGFDSNIAANSDYIETGDSPFLPGDTLLLCSDGLTDMIDNAAIKDVLNSERNLREKGKALIQAANDAGGKDNITVVLVYNDKARVQQEATRPAVNLKKHDEVKQHVDLIGSKADPRTQPVTRKRRRSAVPILLLFCLLFAGAFAWMLYKDVWLRDNKPQPLQTNVKKNRSEQEQKFIDSINNTSSKEVFLLSSVFGQPIVLTDSVSIQKDSLHIIGNGSTILGDSTYRGAALVVAPSCKYLLLDSLTLQNFDVGVLLQNNGLHLKNVQFKNCRVPVQYQFLLPTNITITGRIADTLFYHTDTLPKKGI
jgi:PPM family protein phosphatase